jgi:hypothetical protein
MISVCTRLHQRTGDHGYEGRTAGSHGARRCGGEGLTCKNAGGEGGQGRGRTADLPIFSRSPRVQASPRPSLTRSNSTRLIRGRGAWVAVLLSRLLSADGPVPATVTGRRRGLWRGRQDHQKPAPRPRGQPQVTDRTPTAGQGSLAGDRRAGLGEDFHDLPAAVPQGVSSSGGPAHGVG